MHVVIRASYKTYKILVTKCVCVYMYLHVCTSKSYFVGVLKE